MIGTGEMAEAAKRMRDAEARIREYISVGARLMEPDKCDKDRVVIETANVLVGKEKYDDALHLYDGVLEKNEMNAAALVGRSYVLCKRGHEGVDEKSDYEDAIHACDTALMGGFIPEAHVNKGHALALLGRHDEGITQHKMIYKRDLECATARAGYEGMLSYLSDDHPKAIGVFWDARHADPSSPRWPNLIGMCYARMGSYGEAVRHYNDAYELAEDREWILFNLATAYCEQGEYSLALDSIKAAIKSEPTHHAFFYAEACIKLRMELEDNVHSFDDLGYVKDHLMEAGPLPSVRAPPVDILSKKSVKKIRREIEYQ